MRSKEANFEKDLCVPDNTGGQSRNFWLTSMNDVIENNHSVHAEEGCITINISDVSQKYNVHDRRNIKSIYLSYEWCNSGQIICFKFGHPSVFTFHLQQHGENCDRLWENELLLVVPEGQHVVRGLSERGGDQRKSTSIILNLYFRNSNLHYFEFLIF